MGVIAAADECDAAVDTTKSLACLACVTVRTDPTAALLKQTLTSNPVHVQGIKTKNIAKYRSNLWHSPPSRSPIISRPLSSPTLLQRVPAVSIVNGALAAHMSSHSWRRNTARHLTATVRKRAWCCCSRLRHTLAEHDANTSTMSSYATAAVDSRLNMGAAAA